jgi:putative tryptophan/tyrosine transport system substrate-binding protein
MWYSTVGCIVILMLSLLAAPHATDAQPPGQVTRLGFLRLGSASANAGRVEALRTGLRALGYVEGQNLVMEFRWAATGDQLSEIAAELVHLHVDVIFATSSTEVEAARQATTTIPIVFATHADPVGLGHVASLAQPGGNVTGLSMLYTELVAKGLEIMTQALPHMTRIGVLLTVTAPSHRPAAQALEAAAPQLGVQLLLVLVRTPDDLDGAFATLARERVGGVVVVGSSFTYVHRAHLAALALQHRLPSLFGWREGAEVGGLMSYAADLVDLTRRAATYIDKILKGATPADLPVEQAAKYQLVINLKTAQALGLTLPPMVLFQADEILR